MISDTTQNADLQAVWCVHLVHSKAPQQRPEKPSNAKRPWMSGRAATESRDLQIMKHTNSDANQEETHIDKANSKPETETSVSYHAEFQRQIGTAQQSDQCSTTQRKSARNQICRTQ